MEYGASGCMLWACIILSACQKYPLFRKVLRNVITPWEDTKRSLYCSWCLICSYISFVKIGNILFDCRLERFSKICGSLLERCQYCSVGHICCRTLCVGGNWDHCSCLSGNFTIHCWTMSAKNTYFFIHWWTPLFNSIRLHLWTLISMSVLLALIPL